MKIFFFILLFILDYVTSLPMTTTECDNATCVTEDCIDTAHRLFKNMNLSADPCDDFYEFACGRYVAETQIPDDKGGLSNLVLVGEEVITRGRMLLEDDKSADDFQSDQLARDFYSSCKDEETREKLGVTPILEKLKELGGWPVLEGKGWSFEDTFKWWELSYKMYKNGFDTDFLVKLDISGDAKNASWRVLKMDQAELGLDREYLVKGFEDKDVQEYYKYMVDAAILLGAEPEFARVDLKESLLFEISLAHVTTPKEDRRNDTLLYNPTTIEALPLLDGFPPSWTEYVQNILLDVNNVTVYGFEKIIVANMTYFENLSNLLTKTKPRVLANYLVWQAVKTSMKYLNEEALKIKQRYDKAILGIQVLPPNWKRCTKEVGFDSKTGLHRLGLVAGSMYVRRFFNEEAKEVMLEMFRYLKESFSKDILGGLDWMDEKTKARAQEKLDLMDQIIAYGDDLIDRELVDNVHKDIRISKDRFLDNALHLNKFWKDFQFSQLRVKVDPKTWLEHGDVSIVNAFYNDESNVIIFKAAFLQGVFFNAKIPKYMNYGAVGIVIGHEITHGFDDRGKQRNGKGEIENWWEPDAEKSYKDKAQCIIDQYSNYIDDQVGLNLNGVANQGENIADNGGVKESYYAYLRWVADHQEEAKLVGFPYTPKQMFWISYGQLWCSKYRDADLKNQILTDSHSPGKYRISGVVSNSEDFSKDFNCPIGSNMNPEKKCSVW